MNPIAADAGVAVEPSTDAYPIGLWSAGIALTPEEFDALGPEEFDPFYRYELLHGVLIVTPAPREEERDPNDELGYLLRRYAEDNPQGRALDATLPEQNLHVGPNRRRADRVLWIGLGRRPDRVADIPTIVVEFVSRGRRDWLRDYVEKRAEYLAIGVREYGIVDRFRRTMTVYRVADEEVVAEAGVYRTPLLPGFELPLARLMARADAWGKSAGA